VSFYLDTSAIYSFVFADAHSQRIDNWIARRAAPIFISDWAEAEFYALVWRRLRGGGLTSDAAKIGIGEFEAFVRLHARGLSLSPSSAGVLAANLARDPALKLSAADALHLALAASDGLGLVTFDDRLADAAKARGYRVETL
jgi:predicted nucleic acid-binding protein